MANVSFRITTKNKEVWGEFFILKDHGIPCVLPMNKLTPEPDRVYEIIMNLTENFTCSLFAAWFYDVIKKYSDKTASIGGQQVPPPTVITPLYIEGVVNSIVVNNYAQREPAKKTEKTDN